MLELVEAYASCEVYSVLKRSAEKPATGRAFTNPNFVEEIARDIVKRLKKDRNIT